MQEEEVSPHRRRRLHLGSDSISSWLLEEVERNLLAESR